MRFILGIILVVSSLSFAVTASAQKKKFTKTQEVSFDGQDIDGKTQRPDGSYVNPQKGIKFLPLYKVNKKLDKAIKDSVEFVR